MLLVLLLFVALAVLLVLLQFALLTVLLIVLLIVTLLLPLVVPAESCRLPHTSGTPPGTGRSKPPPFALDPRSRGKDDPRTVPRRCAVRWTALPLLVAIVIAPASAGAELPAGPWPGCEKEAQDECAPDLGEQWNLISWVRDGMTLDDPQEYEMGSGVAADVAWALTAGRTDVVIAVLDSGIEWDAGDVRRKVRLNQGELPEPADGAGPGEPGVWDLDGDGVFTVDDYAADPRVSAADGVDASDGMLDGSDLIAAFSDGTDADGNGFVDDVAGWDFHWNDNDPYDDTRFGHGTSEVRQSCAEGGDGGRIGSCPNCMFLPVRVGDAFIADPDNIAGAILYAADQGVQVIQGALGALGNPPHQRAAVTYAFEHGCTLVLAAGDETSWHHNYPGTNPEALYVSANRYNDEDEASANTYLNNSNCTNYGPRMDLSVPSDGCASGATGIGSGVAGLVYSAALEAGLDPPITPEEVRQLLIATTDDIDVPLSRGEGADPRRYPSWPGWDLFFGHGRVSAGRAVQAVYAGEIPPQAVLDAPDWYQVFAGGAPIEVQGSVSAPRDAVASWTLEWAPGADPRDEDFVAAATGDSATTGLLGTISPADLLAGGVDPSTPADGRDLLEDNVTRALEVHRDSFTLRLSVLDSAGRVGQARRLAFLSADPDLLPAFPLRFDSSVEASPRIADLDGDGLPELVVVASGGDVHVIDPTTGQDEAGWPAWTPLIEEVDPGASANHLGAPAWQALALDPPHEGLLASPAIADLDGDGLQDVVVATERGALIAFSGDGTVLPGFPVRVDPANSEHTSPSIKVERGFLASPAIEDMDADGDLEIVAPAMDGFVYMWHHDGEPVSGWPVPIVSLGPGSSPFNRVVSSPAIGDLDLDGFPDVVVGSNEAVSSQYALLFAIHGRGLDHPGAAYLPNFPVPVFAGYTEVLPVVGEGMPTSPSLADLDGDGRLEIGANAIADPGMIWSADGEVFCNLKATRDSFGGGHNTREDAVLQMMNNGSFGDLDLDGSPEWINGAIGLGFASGFLDDGNRHEFDHLVGVWDAVSGLFEWGFPQVIEDLQFFMNPAVADVSGDELPEVVTASGGHLVHAWDVAGTEAPGFPKPTGGWVAASPATGDLDLDGFIEVVVATRDGYVFAWRTRGVAWGEVQWPTFNHDNRGTGNFHTPLPVVAPPLIEEDCGCASQGASPGSAAVAVLLAGFLAVARRRRAAS